MRVLVVEDEPDLLGSLAKALREDGYAVDTAPDGTEGLYKVENYDYDAIVLDIMLPGIDGWELLRRLRKTKKTPVLLLTARDTVRDRVRGLDTGADDYLVKPFELEELLARLRALGRRPPPRRGITLRAGPIVLDETDRRVTVAGAPVDLSQREYAILECLLRRPGQVLSRDQLLDQAWPYGAALTPNTVEAYIHLLRTKLGDEGAGWIETVRGVGYRVRAGNGRGR